MNFWFFVADTAALIVLVFGLSIFSLRDQKKRWSEHEKQDARLSKLEQQMDTSLTPRVKTVEAKIIPMRRG